MISDVIEKMIIDMLTEEGGHLEIRRNEFAERLGCVPSQINYVLSSRFTPERGFIVESRRGGGGCIRITRVNYNKDTLLTEVLSCIGERIDENTLRGYLVNLIYQNLISEHDAALILSATGDNILRGLPYEYRDRLRAAMFKQMLLTAIDD